MSSWSFNLLLVFCAHSSGPPCRKRGFYQACKKDCFSFVKTNPDRDDMFAARPINRVSSSSGAQKPFEKIRPLWGLCPEFSGNKKIGIPAGNPSNFFASPSSCFRRTVPPASYRLIY